MRIGAYTAIKVYKGCIKGIIWWVFTPARVAGGGTYVSVTAPVTAIITRGGEMVADGFGGEEEGVGEVLGDDVGGTDIKLKSYE